MRLQDLCDISAVTKRPSSLRTMPIPCTTAGPCNAFPSNLLGVGSVCGLGPDLVGIHSISLAARYRVAACSTTLGQGLEKIQTARGHNSAPMLALSSGRKHSLHLPWPVAPRTLSILLIAWTVMANLTKLRTIRSRMLPLDYSVTNCMSRILLDRYPYEPPKFWDRSAVIELRHPAPHETCITCFSSWAHCWRSTHSLQWTMRGSKIPH